MTNLELATKLEALALEHAESADKLLEAARRLKLDPEYFSVDVKIEDESDSLHGSAFW